MGIPSLSFRFAFVFSLSLAVTSSSSSPFLHRFSTSSSIKPSFSPKRVAADLISILGTKEQALRIDAKEASDLTSCLRFLVPFSPTSVEKFQRFSLRRDLFAGDERRSPEFDWKNSKDDDENELVWWPPAPVMELARLAVDSCGDPSAIQRALDPTVLPVPDIEGSKEDRCELTRTPYGRRFVNEELNSYLAFLFEFIVARGPIVGLDVSLNRYDLFHGHLFLATDSGRLGILFHAKEYPSYEKEVFPYNMGYCQAGSNVEYNDSMNLRNILWLAPLPSNSTKAWLAPGVLVVLDAHPGGIIYKDLVPEYVSYVRTIYEEDFGEVVVDVNYLDVGNAVPADKIFIC